MKKGNIGVFDSGVGGVTVLREIVKLLPNENIIYYGDSGNAPYGVRPKEEIQNLCKRVTEFLIKNDCNSVVIACNTATAAALEILSKEYPIPIIGVIDAGARSACKVTKNKRIGVLATPFTIKSKAYVEAIKKFNPDMEVFGAACEKFCPMIEKGWELFEERLELTEEYMAVLPKDIDTLVLGCTHYPIVKNDIVKFYNGEIVDPAKETAVELKNILVEKKLINTENRKGKVKFFVSGDPLVFKNTAEKLLEIEIDKVEKDVY